jgi:RNA polymerase sigma-70 factor (ECF subfamily)
MYISLKRLVGGDKAAWDSFVDRFSPVIYSAIRRTLLAYSSHANDDDARDLMQSVFVRLVKEDYRLLKSYDPSRATLVTWLSIIARSATIDSLRKRSIRTTPLDERALEVSDTPREPVLPVEIPPGLLSARQKLVLHLIFDRGMETDEIGRLLGVEPQTIRSINHKALKKLRTFFGKSA